MAKKKNTSFILEGLRIENQSLGATLTIFKDGMLFENPSSSKLEQIASLQSIIVNMLVNDDGSITYLKKDGPKEGVTAETDFQIGRLLYQYIEDIKSTLKEIRSDVNFQLPENNIEKYVTDYLKFIESNFF